ncbi:MAG: disulfide bond formation protein B, partial [Pseudomonadota bacterium]
AALGLAIVGFVGWRLRGADPLVTAGLGALTLVYLFSTGLATYHAGVEWGFWEGPAACASGPPDMNITGADLLKSLEGPSTFTGPPCETAPWRLFGLSMAGYNALISLALASISGIGCYRAAQYWHNQRTFS